MTGYIWREFPKWVFNVLVTNAEEERAVRETLASPPVPEPDRPASSVAVRMQRSRDRRREGKQAILLDVSIAQIEALVTAGLLDPLSRSDVAEVARAVGRLLDRRSSPIPEHQGETIQPG
jgi:hypothetical protein